MQLEVAIMSGFFDSVGSVAGSAFDSVTESVSSVAHQGWDFFANPNKWEQEHFGTVGGLAPTPEDPIKSDMPTPTLQPTYNNAQAVPEKGVPSPSTELEWEDKQQLAKAGLLNKDEQRMYGVNNWKNPVKY
jgi:hypothetical protein